MTDSTLGGGEFPHADGSVTPPGPSGTHHRPTDGELDSRPASRERVAERVARAGDTLSARGESMRASGGIKGKAGGAAVRAGRALDAGAGYLGTHDAEDIQEELAGRIRAKPLASIAIAAAAGFLIGRLLRS